MTKNIRNTSSSRRQFIKTATLSTWAMAIPDSVLALFGENSASVDFGLISDLHVDIIHDGEHRLTMFLEEMKKKQPDALIQLGDFAIPILENQKIINRFNKSSQFALHVLGNHDMDKGFSREQTVQAFGMPNRYYTSTIKGIQVIVLDGNDPGSPKYTNGYPSFIGNEQKDWLINELERTDQPVLIVSHQPIAGVYTIDNAVEIQQLLTQFSDKILLAINGHAHVDQLLKVGGVNYLHINSASYYWVGQQLAHQSLPEDIHEKYPSLKYTCPYSSPLFALLKIDPKRKQLSLEGKMARWIGPSPLALGYSIVSPDLQELYVQPRISNRLIR